MNPEIEKIIRGTSHREELLEGAIRDAVLRLEETKKHFKSKTIKDVREDLLRVLGKRS